MPGISISIITNAGFRSATCCCTLLQSAKEPFTSRSGVVCSNNSIDPVSYTHLDVYKRQVTGNTKMVAILYAYPACSYVLRFSDSHFHGMRRHYKSKPCISIYHGRRAVSYTHLDVYKRQPRESPAVREQTSRARLRRGATRATKLAPRHRRRALSQSWAPLAPQSLRARTLGGPPSRLAWVSRMHVHEGRGGGVGGGCGRLAGSPILRTTHVH